jgi:hypothetical protein
MVDEIIEALNIGRNDGGVARILVSGGYVQPSVADLVSNGGNFVKNSPHHRVVCSIICVCVIRSTKT